MLKLFAAIISSFTILTHLKIVRSQSLLQRHKKIRDRARAPCPEFSGSFDHSLLRACLMQIEINSKHSKSVERILFLMMKIMEQKRFSLILKLKSKAISPSLF